VNVSCLPTIQVLRLIPGNDLVGLLLDSLSEAEQNANYFLAFWFVVFLFIPLYFALLFYLSFYCEEKWQAAPQQNNAAVYQCGSQPLTKARRSRKPICPGRNSPYVKKGKSNCCGSIVGPLLHDASSKSAAAPRSRPVTMDGTNPAAAASAACAASRLAWDCVYNSPLRRNTTSPRSRLVCHEAGRRRLHP